MAKITRAMETAGLDMEWTYGAGDEEEARIFMYTNNLRSLQALSIGILLRVSLLLVFLLVSLPLLSTNYKSKLPIGYALCLSCLC